MIGGLSLPSVFFSSGQYRSGSFNPSIMTWLYQEVEEKVHVAVFMGNVPVGYMTGKKGPEPVGFLIMHREDFLHEMRRAGQAYVNQSSNQSVSSILAGPLIVFEKAGKLFVPPSRWIPVTERYPTEEDADKDGFVMIRWRRRNKPSDIGMERAIWDSLDDDADGEMTEIHFLPLNNALPEHIDEQT